MLISILSITSLPLFDRGNETNESSVNNEVMHIHVFMRFERTSRETKLDF